MTKIGLGAMLVVNEYEITAQKRVVALDAEAVVGAQLPIYFYKNDQVRWSLSAPISFSVWNDFTEDRTSPVLNTDYRFAVVEFNYSKKLNKSGFNNIGVRIIPFFHESSHIGDELIIAKLQDTIPSARINVSYETFDLSFMVNDPYDQKIKNHSLRVGAKVLWSPNKGYYTADTLEIEDGLKIDPSKRWIEPYLQYQFQNPNGILSNDNMMFVFSQDVFLRVRYGYPFSTSNDQGEVIIEDLGEAYKVCANTMFGWKFLKNKEISKMGVFVNLYLGINPHGQFRNVNRYHWAGLHFVYDI